MNHQKRSRLGTLVCALLLSTAFSWPSLSQQPVQEPVSEVNENTARKNEDGSDIQSTSQVARTLSQAEPSQPSPIVGIDGRAEVVRIGESEELVSEPQTDTDTPNTEQGDYTKALVVRDATPISYEKLAALSAFAMAAISALGLVVSTIGVWFLIKTYRATLIAAKAAQASALAAEKVIKQDRAEIVFVDGSSKEDGRLYLNDETVGDLIITWTVKNYGKTPAYQVCTHLSIQEIEPFNPNLKSAPITPEPVFLENFPNLLPDDRVKAARFFVPLGEIKSAFEHKKSLLVKAKLTYIDKYEEPRFTETACQIRPIGRDLRLNLFDPDGNDLRYEIDFRLNGSDRAG